MRSRVRDRRGREAEEHRRAREAKHDGRDREQVEHHELHLGRADALAEVLGRPADHEACDETARIANTSIPYRPAPTPPGDYLAEHMLDEGERRRQAA